MVVGSISSQCFRAFHGETVRIKGYIHPNIAFSIVWLYVDMLFICTMMAIHTCIFRLMLLKYIVPTFKPIPLAIVQLISGNILYECLHYSVCHVLYILICTGVHAYMYMYNVHAYMCTIMYLYMCMSYMYTCIRAHVHRTPGVHIHVHVRVHVYMEHLVLLWIVIILVICVGKAILQ